MAAGDYYYWTGESNDWSAVTAWRKNDPVSGTNEVPTADSHVRILRGTKSITLGLNTGLYGSTQIASLVVAGGPDGYRGSIGTSTQSLQVDVSGNLRYAGLGPLFKFSGDVTGDLVIENTANTANPVIIDGTNTITTIKGFVLCVTGSTPTIINHQATVRVEEGATFTSYVAYGGRGVFRETPGILKLYGNARVQTDGDDDCETLVIDSPTAILDTRGQSNYIAVTHSAGLIDATNCVYDIFLGDDDTSAGRSAGIYQSTPVATVYDSQVGGSVTIANAAPIGLGGSKYRPQNPRLSTDEVTGGIDGIFTNPDI